MEKHLVMQTLSFHTEERQDPMLNYFVDLYAEDFERFPNTVSWGEAYFDRARYYTFAHLDPHMNRNKDRQLNIFG